MSTVNISATLPNPARELRLAIVLVETPRLVWARYRIVNQKNRLQTRFVVTLGTKKGPDRMIRAFPSYYHGVY
jgi:hypothetical protein